MRSKCFWSRWIETFCALLVYDLCVIFSLSLLLSSFPKSVCLLLMAVAHAAAASYCDLSNLVRSIFMEAETEMTMSPFE